MWLNIELNNYAGVSENIMHVLPQVPPITLHKYHKILLHHLRKCPANLRTHPYHHDSKKCLKRMTQLSLHRYRIQMFFLLL